MKAHHAVPLLLSVLVACPASAQFGLPQLERGGLWGTLGLGAGVGNADCSNCEHTGTRGGLGIELALGGTLPRSVLLGAVLGIWTAPVSPSPAIMKFAIRTQFYPLRYQPGFFATGSFGIGGIEYTSDTVNVSSLGTAYEIGIGWDLPPRKRFALSPYVALLVVSGSRDIDPSDGILSEERFTPWALTAGVRLAAY